MSKLEKLIIGGCWLLFALAIFIIAAPLTIAQNSTILGGNVIGSWSTSESTEQSPPSLNCSGTPQMQQLSSTTSYLLGSATGYYYVGATNSADVFTSPTNICRIDYEMGTNTGNIANKVFVAQVWTKSGRDLDVLLQTSSAVYGSNITEAAYHTFNFSPPLALTNTLYAFVVTMNEVDAANYPSVRYHSAGGIAAITNARWQSSKVVAGGSSSSDIAAKYYFAW